MWLGLNAILGSLVVTLGFMMIWDDLPLAMGVPVGVAVAAFLIWQSPRIAMVWAWATLLLGIESLAWPLVMMIQTRMTTAAPTEAQMVGILNAILFGVFSSVFWLTFSYGLFKRFGRGPDQP